MKSQSKKPKFNALKSRQALADLVLVRLSALNPDPHTELYFLTPFQLLCSVVLSAQTTDKSVNRCMTPLYDAGFTPETITEWGEAKLLSHIRTIGLAPTKAKNLVRLAHMIEKDFAGQVPRHREELMSLPGVGTKTASVVLAELYGEPTLAVDTHVFRVSQRLGLQRESNPEKAEKVLLEVIPKKWRPKAHHWLILHGRYTCKAIKPLCARCMLEDLCPAAGAGKKG